MDGAGTCGRDEAWTDFEGDVFRWDTVRPFRSVPPWSGGMVCSWSGPKWRSTRTGTFCVVDDGRIWLFGWRCLLCVWPWFGMCCCCGDEPLGACVIAGSLFARPSPGTNCWCSVCSSTEKISENKDTCINERRTNMLSCICINITPNHTVPHIHTHTRARTHTHVCVCE